MGTAQREAGEGDLDVVPEAKRKLGFARQLASCNKKIRDRAVEVLRQWLISHEHVGEEDLKKIWKGLFYCVWHADKQPVQAHLIHKLASLLLTLDLNLSRLYFQVFLLTMRREWSGIDYLRLDKFYLLLRRFLNHVFLLLKTGGWNSQTTKDFMDTLTDRAFLVVDKYPAHGINLHFVDVYLNELGGFLPLPLETLGLVFEPFYAVLAKAPDKRLVRRVHCNVFDCLLENGRKLIVRRREEGHRGDADADDDADDDVEKFGCIALTMRITERLFELATSPCTLQANRKTIYALHEEFGKLDKHFSASGVSDLPKRAKKQKLSTDKCLPATHLTVADQQVETERGMTEESTPHTGKKIKGKKRKSPKAVNVGDINDETPTGKKATSKGISKHSKKKPCLKGQQDEVDEVRIDHMCNNHEAADERRNSANGNTSLGDSMELHDSVIPNLQKQFEKVAAEQGDDLNPFGSPVTSFAAPVCNSSTGAKKRKRVKNADQKITKSASLPGDQDKEGSAAGSVHLNGVNSAAKTGNKSVKKVRFSMKSNLIWKPHSPLPPQSVRLPPSTTPRGSALKKGVPPGPIRVFKEPPSPKRLWARSLSVQKSSKILKTISPSGKLLQFRRLRRLNIW